MIKLVSPPPPPHSPPPPPPKKKKKHLIGLISKFRIFFAEKKNSLYGLMVL